MDAKEWGGLTPVQIADSLRNRADYFRTAEGGWRDDSAALLDTAAGCIRGLWRLAGGQKHWRGELETLCDLIIERANEEELSTHVEVSFSDVDARAILTRAERLKQQMQPAIIQSANQ